MVVDGKGLIGCFVVDWDIKNWNSWIEGKLGNFFVS